MVKYWYQFSLPQSTLRAQSFNYYFLEIFYKALISAFSLRGVGPYGPEAANSAVNYYKYCFQLSIEAGR